MKFLFLILSFPLFAAVPPFTGGGPLFLTSGDISNPGANQSLLDSGAFSTGSTTETFTSIKATLNASVAAIFEIGVFDSGGTAVKTFTYGVLAGDAKNVDLPVISVIDTQHIKIRNVTLIVLGTVNVSLSVRAMGSD